MKIKNKNLIFTLITILFIAIFLFLFIEKNKKNKNQHLIKLKFGFSNSLNSLNPIINTNSTLNLIYEPLVKIKPPFEISPVIAKSWNTPTSTQWRFVLKKNIFFHSGKPLTGKDVVYTIKIYKKYSDLNLSSIKNVETFKNVVTINTVNFDPDLLLKLSNVYIIPKNSFENIISHPNGTGKYKFKKWNNLEEVEFVKNKEYWGKIESLVDQFEIEILSNPDALIKKIISKKIDFCTISKVMDVDIKKDSQVKKIIHSSFTTIYLGIHLNENKFTHGDLLYLRSFFSINIDREKISQKYIDFLRPTFSPIYSLIYNFNSNFLSEIPINLKKPDANNFNLYCEKNLKNVAKEIKINLEKLGYNIKILTLKNFKYSQTENYLILFSYNFLKNGIFSFFLDTCLKNVKGNFIKSGKYNFINYEDSGMKKLINDFSKMKDYSNFIEKACKIFTEKYPYIPLFEKNNLILINKKNEKFFRTLH